MARHRGLFGANHPEKAQENVVDPQEIARVAYGLYEQRDREDGHALDDWLKAEAVVREQNQHTSRIVA